MQEGNSMSGECVLTIDAVLRGARASIVDEWVAQVTQAWERRYPNLIGVAELRHQAERLLDGLIAVFAGAAGGAPADIGQNSPLARPTPRNIC
jgi:hypothetical protein